jgi:hypothetical protein
MMRTEGLDQSLSGIDGVVVAKLAGMIGMIGMICGIRVC